MTGLRPHRPRTLAIVALLALCTATASIAPLNAASTAPADLSDAASAAIEEAATNAATSMADDEADDETSATSILADPAIDLRELEHRLVPLTRAELNQLAGQWLEIVRAKTEEVMAAQIAIDRTEDEVEDEVTQRVADLMFERNALFQKFTAVTDAWEKKGGDPDLIAEAASCRACPQTSD